MADPNPPPRLPDIVPQNVQSGQNKACTCSPLSSVHANDTPIANLFGESHGLSHNKRISNPRETTGLTPARKKYGAPIHRASYLKVQSAIQEQLAKWLSLLLHVLNSLAEGNNCLSDQPVVPPNGDAMTNLDVDVLSSDDDDYNPAPEYLIPPPQRWHKKKINTKSSKPKVVLDRSFMWFLWPGTFNNQLFKKGQQLMYSIAEMDWYNAEYRRQLHYNFSKTQNTQKQRQSTKATCASQLHDIDLDAPPEQLMLRYYQVSNTNCRGMS